MNPVFEISSNVTRGWVARKQFTSDGDEVSVKDDAGSTKVMWSKVPYVLSEQMHGKVKHRALERFLVKLCSFFIFVKIKLGVFARVFAFAYKTKQKGKQKNILGLGFLFFTVSNHLLHC